MKTTLSLLVASTALAAALGVPAIAAMRGAAGDDAPVFAATHGDDAHGMPITLASGYGDDDDDAHRTYRKSARHDDDDDHDDRDEDDDDDDDDLGKGAANPARAGTVAPPSNGLFTDGAKPQVKMK